MMVHYLHVFLFMIRLSYKTRLMYPVAYFNYLFAKLIGYGADYAIILLLIDRFRTIAGWTLPEILVLHSLQIISLAFFS